MPDRTELGPRSARLALEPVRLDPRGFAPLHLAGAWRLTSDDPRFGGISALALDGGSLLALSDSGVLVRFAKLEGSTVSAAIRELPDGPGDPRFKSRRDSEAIVRDASGRGWWVAFENRNELWLYDGGFARPL
ncbi:MAG: esterase-like activity of phytase family protein, partial [Sphingomicrobium sp.]